jgi:hypothetical protein
LVHKVLEVATVMIYGLSPRRDDRALMIAHSRPRNDDRASMTAHR